MIAGRPLARVVGALAAGAVVLGALTACEWPRRLVEGAVEDALEGPFYASPSPQPHGAPGEVLRTAPIASAADGVSAWRVIYHSTDLRGDDVLVSGVVAVPSGPAPKGGRTVVAWGHPTTGTAPRCAPSVGIDPFVTIEGFAELIRRGYAVVATDYLGMGIGGQNSYLVGGTAGRNVLDAVRAAVAMDIGASERVALWGHSQGGQAVLFAAELAEEYAPELRVESVAVAAPAIDLGALLDADIGDVSGVTIAAYAFDAFAGVYADRPGVALDTILTPPAIDALPAMSALCLFGQNAQLHDIATPLIDDFLIADPASTEPWVTLLAENTPGATRYAVPLFVAQGGSDTLVEPALTADFARRQVELGTDVTSLVVQSATHATIAIDALPDLLVWLAEVAPSTA